MKNQANRSSTSAPYFCNAYAHLAGNGDATALVYAHLSLLCQPNEKNNRQRVFEGSKGNLATFLGYHPDTIREALHNLVNLGFLTRTERPGRAPRYQIITHDEWKDQHPGKCVTYVRSAASDRSAGTDPSRGTDPTCSVEPTAPSGVEPTPPPGVEPTRVLRESIELKSEGRIEGAHPFNQERNGHAFGGGDDNTIAEARSLAVDLSFVSDGTVIFNDRDKAGLARLLDEDFTPADIVAAFKAFYENLNKENVRNLDFAAKNFVETADQLILLARKKKADRVQQDTQLEAAKSRMRAEAEAELAAAQAADEEDAEVAL